MDVQRVCRMTLQSLSAILSFVNSSGTLSPGELCHSASQQRCCPDLHIFFLPLAPVLDHGKISCLFPIEN
jgi:hypothetical protein